MRVIEDDDDDNDNDNGVYDNDEAKDHNDDDDNDNDDGGEWQYRGDDLRLRAMNRCSPEGMAHLKEALGRRII
ncbi:hypothetical protein PoB_001649500 [Plakobranchus ocellatus]|uniref:Uncharacterized protein n=1 Tax=Plakobranchus ocellatus TaxID=259542 RepID=A0AAV3Z3I9_9GAST|nr:hypothetical protein PoB_001649500 [Plakobranchus ocellatus]